MHFTQITDMPEYHNLQKFKNQEVLSLKFHKKIQWVPHRTSHRLTFQTFSGGGKTSKIDF